MEFAIEISLSGHFWARGRGLRSLPTLTRISGACPPTRLHFHYISCLTSFRSLWSKDNVLLFRESIKFHASDWRHRLDLITSPP